MSKFENELKVMNTKIDENNTSPNIKKNELTVQINNILRYMMDRDNKEVVNKEEEVNPDKDEIKLELLNIKSKILWKRQIILMIVVQKSPTKVRTKVVVEAAQLVLVRK